MYRAVLIYSSDGEYLGCGIKEDDAIKLHSTNIYTEEEESKLDEALTRLNESVNLTAHWPDSRDPEVEALLSRDDFMPLEMIEAEVVDDENSYYVYTQEPEYDIAGQPTGKTIDGDIDEDASVIKLKKMMVPVRPSDQMERTKKACEIIARKRAGVAMDPNYVIH